MLIDANKWVGRINVIDEAWVHRLTSRNYRDETKGSRMESVA